MPEVEIEEFEVEQPYMKRAQPSSAPCPVAPVSQLIPTMDRLSIICELAEIGDVDVQSAETEEKVKIFLRAKLEIARCE